MAVDFVQEVWYNTLDKLRPFSIGREWKEEDDYGQTESE